jgi:3-methyl-2-oxobutanoate hydroxymethyltransferase
VKVPTIGIGAGPEVDGQILVLNDLLGLTQGFSPKFVKRFRELGTEVRQAVEEYTTEVRTGEFPGKQHSYSADKKPWSAGIEKNCG